MGELIIENPVINDDFYRRYAYEDSRFRSTFGEWLCRREITPKVYPRVLDLCAGDGSISKILVNHGWDPKNMTCVDRHKSPTPLIKGATWRYWDLEVLADYLNERREIPEEILEYKNVYDLVVLWNGFLRKTTEIAVCKFFVRSEGKWFMDAVYF